MHLVLLIYQAMSQHLNILCFNSEKTHVSLSSDRQVDKNETFKLEAR